MSPAARDFAVRSEPLMALYKDMVKLSSQSLLAFADIVA